MAKIVSIHSFRGGTGKSNVTANLAVTIARSGKRVAVVDTDIQSPGIHVLFGLDESRFKYSLNDYLWGRCRIEQTACDVTPASLVNGEAPAPGSALFLAPSSIKAGEIARVLREGYDIGLLNDGFHELIRTLDLDFLLIDTHPGVNEETLLSIAISNLLLLILRPDHQDFQGTAVTVELARKLDVGEMWLLLNKVPPGRDVPGLVRQVEEVFRAGGGRFSLNMEMAHLASGGIFCRQFPRHVFTRELEQLASRIV